VTTIGGPRILSAEVAFAAKCELAEGPIWDDRRQLLLWVDILAGNVHTLDIAGGAHSSFSAGMPVGAVGLDASGGLVLALADGFAVADADGRHLRRVAEFRADTTTVRFNDGKPDPWGGFCAGTMRWRGSAALGSLYRLSPSGGVAELLTGVEVSNGMDWTDDLRRFYYVDSHAGGIDIFDTDPGNGALSGRRRFVDVPATTGVADGLSLDADGAVWVALHGSGEVRRYAPDGRLDTVVPIPVRQVTSVAFGGPQLSTLFITTARDGADATGTGERSHAGDIFCCMPGTPGRPPFRYAPENGSPTRQTS
jgi:sugar lactone lactonase YvrE